MPKSALKTVLFAVIITTVTGVLAIVVNAVRSDGIDLVATVPYDIFSECKDSTVTSVTITETDLNSAQSPIYVDARPKVEFDKEHVKDAVNIPYSALFGATPKDIEKLKNIQNKRTNKAIVVYGLFKEGENEPIDFAKPLAEQLIEMGIETVKYTSEGIETLKQQGASIVKAEQ